MEWFYGSGEQTALPGIGLMNKASLGYMYRFNPRWSVQVGVDAMKMNMPFAVGQSFGTSGAVMYRASDRVAFKYSVLIIEVRRMVWNRTVMVPA